MIPKSFQLFGRTYKVQMVDALPNNWMGMADHTAGLVGILKPNTEFKPSKDSLEHVYFHEVAHVILTALGEEALNENEAFVDRLAGCIHQVLKSSKGALLAK